MGRAAFLLSSHKADERKRLREEAEAAQAEQEQRGGWGNIGKLIGSVGLPMLVAAISGPIGWAAAAGWAAAGSYVGQKAGREAAEIGDKEDKTKVEKGKFFKGETDEIQADIDAMGKDDGDMLKEALWDGAMAGTMAIGKEGLKAIGAKVATKLPAGAKDFAAKKMGFTSIHPDTGATITDVAAMEKMASGEAFTELFSSESMWGESMGGFKPTDESWIGTRRIAKAEKLAMKDFERQAGKVTEAFGEEIEPGVFEGGEVDPYVETEEFTDFLEEDLDWLKEKDARDEWLSKNTVEKGSQSEGLKDIGGQLGVDKTNVKPLGEDLEFPTSGGFEMMPEAKKAKGIIGFGQRLIPGGKSGWLDARTGLDTSIIQPKSLLQQAGVQATDPAKWWEYKKAQDEMSEL